MTTAARQKPPPRPGQSPPTIAPAAKAEEVARKPKRTAAERIADRKAADTRREAAEEKAAEKRELAARRDRAEIQVEQIRSSDTFDDKQGAHFNAVRCGGNNAIHMVGTIEKLGDKMDPRNTALVTSYLRGFADRCYQDIAEAHAKIPTD